MFEQRRQRNSGSYFLTSTSAKKKNRSLDGRDKSSSIVYFDQFNLDSSVDQTSSNNRLLELCKSKIFWEDEGPVFYSELQKKMTLGHFF